MAPKPHKSDKQFKQEIRQAIEQLAENGKASPGSRAVHAIVGGNYPRMLGLLNEVKAEDEILHERQRSVPEISDAALDIAKALWAEAYTTGESVGVAARAGYEAQIEERAAENAYITGLNTELDAQGTELQSKIDTLEAELAAERMAHSECRTSLAAAEKQLEGQAEIIALIEKAMAPSKGTAPKPRAKAKANLDGDGPVTADLPWGDETTDQTDRPA